MLYENELRNIFSRNISLPQIDTMRDALKVIEVDGLNYILAHTVKKAIENKVFDRSYKRCCLECLTIMIKGRKYYYHYASVMSIIGDGPKLTLGFETI